MLGVNIIVNNLARQRTHLNFDSKYHFGTDFCFLGKMDDVLDCLCVLQCNYPLHWRVHFLVPWILSLQNSFHYLAGVTSNESKEIDQLNHFDRSHVFHCLHCILIIYSKLIITVAVVVLDQENVWHCYMLTMIIGIC